MNVGLTSHFPIFRVNKHIMRIHIYHGLFFRREVERGWSMVSRWKETREVFCSVLIQHEAISRSLFFGTIPCWIDSGTVLSVIMT